jgi:hypothetical protein
MDEGTHLAKVRVWPGEWSAQPSGKARRIGHSLDTNPSDLLERIARIGRKAENT